MEQYIPKAAVVAEIEKIIADETESIKSFEHSKNVSEVQRSNARIGVLTHLCSLLDTLETKEVDLEKDVKQYLKDNFASVEEPDEVLTTLMQLDDMVLFAKHFIELGMTAGDKAMEE